MRPILYLLPLLFSSVAYAVDFVQSVSNQERLIQGKIVYERRCSGCHGVSGNGKGPAAAFLNPAPRDFTSGIFKFRSSPLGTLPSDLDLMRTLSYGVRGTSMPAFPFIPERERLALVEYIKTFAKETWSDPTLYAPAVTGAPFPKADFISFKPFIQRAKKGRSLYIEACVTCHGVKGLGDGESAQELEDDWEMKVLPANLTNKTIKRGPSVEDIYLTLLVGVNGTPMPSFKDSYSDDQLWDLTAFVFYLRGKGQGLYSKDHVPAITAAEIE